MSMSFRGGWGNLVFPKRGSEVVKRAEDKVSALKRKLEERQERVKVICATKGLNITDLLSNLDGFSNNISNAQFNMNVGEMEQLKSEARAMKDEKESLSKLQLIARNLPKEEDFELTFEQLEYLDF